MINVESDFEHEGLRCVVVKQPMGHRCGYVGVPKGHDLYGKDAFDTKDESLWDISVHGGLTYSEGGEINKYPVESIDTWWFGFDTAHYWDTKNPKSTEYCINECKKLAEQLQEVE